MPTARIVLITVPTAASTTHFNLRYSTNADDWTDYYTTGSTLEDLAVAVLSSGVYTLDGLNSPTGNKAAASYLGNFYQIRLKSAGGYGNWSEPFRVSAYPTATDLQAFLTAHGVTLTSGQEVQCASAIAAGIADFERATDRKPFLAGPSVAKVLDPPTMYDEGRSILFLKRDLATFTSLVYQPTNGTAETLVRGEDFQLQPYDADDTDEFRPFDRIDFYGRRWLSPHAASVRYSLTLTGTWGYSTILPDDVWQAMLCQGAGGMWTILRQYNTNGMLGWKDGDRSVDYGIQSWSALSDAWAAQYQAAVSRYRRLSF